jgi:hypothetical protein
MNGLAEITDNQCFISSLGPKWRFGHRADSGKMFFLMPSRYAFTDAESLAGQQPGCNNLEESEITGLVRKPSNS